MATTPESSCRAAISPYMPVAAHELRRQMSMPAALAATFATCGSRGGRGWPRNLIRDDESDGDDGHRGRAPRPAAGGVGAVVRALWAWVARSRRRKAVMSRSGSSSVKERPLYGHEEYAQNFDEGGAAVEPENLSRSFSARYAVGRRGSPARMKSALFA